MGKKREQKTKSPSVLLSFKAKNDKEMFIQSFVSMSTNLAKVSQDMHDLTFILSRVEIKHIVHK